MAPLQAEAAKSGCVLRSCLCYCCSAPACATAALLCLCLCCSAPARAALLLSVQSGHALRPQNSARELRPQNAELRPQNSAIDGLGQPLLIRILDWLQGVDLAGLDPQDFHGDALL